MTDDLEHMRFNTAISKLMVFARDVTKRRARSRARAAEAFVLMMSPMAPHLAEELWSLRSGTRRRSRYAAWPVADEVAPGRRRRVSLVVQHNGKKRGEISVAADADEETIRAAALAVENVQKSLGEREPKKVIVVPGRLVNVVG